MDNRLFIEAEKGALERITEALDGLAYKAPTVLKDTANATGKYAVKKLLDEAERRYDYDHGKIILKDMIKRESATYANPRSTISVKSYMNKMIHFNVSPVTAANGSGRPASYKGRVLKSSAMDVLGDRGVKAFVVRFKNNSVQLVSRRLGESYSSGSGGKLKERVAKKLDPTKIDVVYAPSETHMFSKAFNDVQEDIKEKKQQNTKKYINKVLKGLEA